MLYLSKIQDALAFSKFVVLLRFISREEAQRDDRRLTVTVPFTFRYFSLARPGSS
jgi:hypothetical protein